MYIRITSRCNMTCEHCCYSCTHKGADMSEETYRKALEMSDSMVSIGGGEPTMHPKFWQFLMEAITQPYMEYVWMATNGSNTPMSLALAGLAKKGVLGVALSQDSYHDEIDEEVVEAFSKETRKHSGFDNNTPDSREIRNVEGNEINGGRCDFGTEEGCVCADLIVEPDGTIKGCGCADAPTFGTVFDPAIPDNWADNWEYGKCSKNQEED